MRTDYLESAHQAGKMAPASDVPGFLKALTEMDAAADGPGRGGYLQVIRSLAATYPDAFTDPELAGLLDVTNSDLADLTPDKPGSNDVLLAGWAFSGSVEPLTELLRRLLHRDGSNVSDSVGGDAVALVMEAAEADPDFAAALGANNFNLARFRFGNHPAGSFSLPLVSHVNPGPRRTQVAGTTQAAAAPAAVAKTTAAAPAVSVPRRVTRTVSVSEGLAAADHAAGSVRIGGASLSLSDAVKLRDSVTTAVVELLRPAEGFQWLDDNHDPQSRSILVDLDGIRGKGLPEVGGGLLQGEVIQIASRGPDPDAGKYLGRLYNKTGGFTEFATGSLDANAAKFAVAERVRQELAG